QPNDNFFRALSGKNSGLPARIRRAYRISSHDQQHEEFAMPDSPGRKLRQAWKTGPIAIPGAFNALAARMIERLGFHAVYLSGGALSASCGMPDIGLTTLSQFVDHARLIAQATSLPLLCDADTGFGEPLNVARSVHLF